MAHLKSLSAPKSWKIERKKFKLITRPNPGMHRFSEGLPLVVVLRDMLSYCSNTKEVKYTLSNQEIKIDGIRREDYRFLTGIFDIISIPKLKQNFRVLINEKGKIEIRPMKEETMLKPCKIIGKTKVGKKTQLNLYDGRNILVEKDSYKVGDTLFLEVPSHSIREHIKLEAGVTAYLTKGKGVGSVGKLEEIKGTSIIFKKRSGEKIETKKDYAIAIGKDKPLIEI